MDLDPAITHAVLTRVPAAFNANVQEVLLAAFALALSAWRGSSRVDVNLEGHGRYEDVAEHVDLSSTVGWFTSRYPVSLECDPELFADRELKRVSAFVKRTKESLRSSPDGVNYQVLRYFDPSSGLQEMKEPNVGFNYLGRVAVDSENSEWRPVSVGGVRPFLGGMSEDVTMVNALEVNAITLDSIEGPRLSAVWNWAGTYFDEAQIAQLGRHWFEALEVLVDKVDAGASGVTPSDLVLKGVSQSLIDTLDDQGWGRIADVLPATPVQEGLIFHTDFGAVGHRDIYNVQLNLGLEGPVDAALLRKSLNVLVQRHPHLAARFRHQSDRAIQIIPATVDMPFQQVDISAEDPDTAESHLTELLAEARATQFDSSHDVLIRALLIRIAPERHLLSLVNHHLILDGWSMPVLLRELLSIYEHHGSDSALPTPIPYRRFFEWLETNVDHDASLSAWEELLTDAEPFLIAPETPDEPTEMEVLDCVLPEDLYHSARKLAADQGLTFSTCLQVAWALTLAKFTGRTDVIYGSPVSGRPADLTGHESMVGLFINTIPIRIPCPPALSVADIFAQAQATNASLLDHHHIGLTDLHRISGTHKLFDSMFVVENYPMSNDDFATTGRGFTVSTLEGHDQTHYPLTVAVLPRHDLAIRATFRTDVFDRESVQLLVERFQRVLEAVINDPLCLVGSIDVLTDDERRKVLEQWNDGGAVEAERLPLLPDMVSARAGQAPDKTAVVYGDVSLTYGQLEEASNQLARLLISQGVGPETIVGLAVPRSPEMVISMLAVLKAGGAYLPIDTSYPPDRIAFMLTDAQPLLLLTTTEVVDLLGDTNTTTLVLDDAALHDRLTGHTHHSNHRPRHRHTPLHPHNAAYIIYTSGSTGTPKGVVMHQCGLANLLACQSQLFL
ncbi:condensation domain-containing protein [Mycolicibacterium baixiangningiae]|uniref:condensation domain-containing protein n=1 Tax=Mycolicibacterium baixiangningiae TaxID=2761578 RepID=UPI0018E5FD83|nr:condensation domain-containing protein [Mycolicibacterium baixiangningiae]